MSPNATAPGWFEPKDLIAIYAAGLATWQWVHNRRKEKAEAAEKESNAGYISFKLSRALISGFHDMNKPITDEHYRYVLILCNSGAASMVVNRVVINDQNYDTTNLPLVMQPAEKFRFPLKSVPTYIGPIKVKAIASNHKSWEALLDLV